jgi:hypothetical protein
MLIVIDGDTTDDGVRISWLGDRSRRLRRTTCIAGNQT